MNKNAIVAILGAGCLTASAGCAKDDVSPSSASCALAADYLSGMKPDGAKAFVYTDDAESSWSPLAYDGWFATGKAESGAPPKALIYKFNNTRLVSAVKYCAAARAALDKLGVPYGESAAKSASDKPAFDVEGVAAPVMSDDGTAGLLVLSSRKSNLLVDRVIQYMRRDNSGHWVVAALHSF